MNVSISFSACVPSHSDVKYMGKTEEFIGNWLEKHQDMRSKLIIATKVHIPLGSTSLSAQPRSHVTAQQASLS